VPIGLTDAPYALLRVLVAEMPAEGVAGIRRVRDDPAATDDVRRASNEPHLGIHRMQFEIVAQGRPRFRSPIGSCASRVRLYAAIFAGLRLRTRIHAGSA
jgi:hypothetical protein